MIKNKKPNELTIDELKELLAKKEKEEYEKKINSRSILEQEFIKAQTEANELMNEKIEEVKKIVDTLTNISEEFGIPFYHNNETYTPVSFEEKFGDLDRDWLLNNADIVPNYYSGWSSSSSNC